MCNAYKRYREALTRTEEAQEKLSSYTGTDTVTFYCLTHAIEEAKAYQKQMYHRWQRELAEAEAVAVEISVNVKENVLQ